MINDKTYRGSFMAAVGFHVLLAFLLVAETSTSRPVLKKETITQPGETLAVEQQPNQEIVKAVNVDNQEVMETVNRLKAERTRQLQAEQARQKQLNAAAEKAKAARILEQQRLTKLKDEAVKLALAQKKKAEEEKKHLKELAQKKELEAKQLEELKKKQQQELVKLTELKNKQAREVKEAKEREAKELALKQEAERRAEAANKAAQQAKMAGEVDKYKALIVNAIGRRWILPDNVDSSLSSQFKIRLAPDGAVLEVSLIKSSGDAVLDHSAQSAIYKASPLPVPVDPTVFAQFREINLTVRPENVRG